MSGVKTAALLHDVEIVVPNCCTLATTGQVHIKGYMETGREGSSGNKYLCGKMRLQGFS